MNETTGERYTAGLRLPGLRLQVFEVRPNHHLKDDHEAC